MNAIRNGYDKVKQNKANSPNKTMLSSGDILEIDV